MHVDEAMQLAQDVVRDMAAGPRFAVQENRDLGILVADFRDKGAQLGQRFLRLLRQFLVVDRQDEGRRPALLLGERGQVTVTGDTEHFQPFLFQRCGQRADTQAGTVLRAEILVDDDDRKVKTHGESFKCSDPPQRVTEYGVLVTRL